MRIREREQEHLESIAKCLTLAHTYIYIHIELVSTSFRLVQAAPQAIVGDGEPQTEGCGHPLARSASLPKWFLSSFAISEIVLFIYLFYY